jgi:hypothetical protein
MSVQEKDNKILKKSRSVSRWKRVLLILLGIFVILLLAISILSTNSHVQEWYGNKLANYLSSRTGYPIEMGITEASVFRGIVVKDLNITDLEGNQMISVEEIETSLRKNLFSLLFHNKINLDNLKIINGELLIKKYAGDEKSNLSRFFSSFASKNKDDDNNCRDMSIKQVIFENISLKQETKALQHLDSYIGKARIDFNKLDICNKFVDIKKIVLESGDLNFLLENGYNSEGSDSESEDSLQRDTFSIVVHHLLMDDGHFSFTNENKLKARGFKGIDYNALDLQNIELELRNLHFNNHFEGDFEMEQLSFKEQSGFEVQRLSIEQGSVNGQEIELNNLILETPASLAQQDVKLRYKSYPDFLDFSDKVSLDLEIQKAEVIPTDIFYFASPLASNQFFRENSRELLQLEGSISGKVNSLRGKDIQVVLQDGSRLSGAFSSRNLTISGEQLMNIRLQEFKSRTTTIAKLLPGIEFTDAFHRLGKLQFKGSFDGYFHDFVAYGNLLTDLGRMNMDMRLDLSKGADLAEYSGNFSLNSFDLGVLSNREDIGNISLSAKVLDGQGLNINTVNADLFARVDSLEFKNHTYQNLVMDGYLDKDLFNGDFSIDEAFIKVNLSGLVNYGDSIPKFRFDASIDHLDLYRLNISEYPLKVSSNVGIDLSGNDLNNIAGKMVARKLFLSNGEKSILLDSVVVSSQMSGSKERYVDLSSELISFYFDGVYQLNKIPDALIDVLKKNHPELMEKVPYLSKTADDPDYYYDFYVYIPQSKSLFEILQPLAANVEEMVINGHVDHERSSFKVKSTAKALEIGKVDIKNFVANIDMINDVGDIDVHGENLAFGNSSSDSIFFNAKINRDLLNYTIRFDTLDDKLRKISIAATTKAHKKGFETNILNGNIQFLDDRWYLKNNNKIVLGKDYVELENFSLINGLNMLTLEHINQNQGIKAVISGFDIGVLNAFLNSEKIRFSGKSEGFVLMPTLFREQVFEGAIRLPQLYVNDDPYGEFSTLIQLDPRTKDKIKFNGNLDNSSHHVVFTGDYQLRNKELKLDINAEKFPIAFLEYLIQDNISGTEGFATGNISFNGPVKALKVSGEAMAYKAKTKVDYLGTTYFADEQKVRLNSKLIDFTGVELMDELGNKAKVTGGIRHQLFRDMSLDMSIQSPRILGLKTNKQMNPMYYGTGIGSANIRFNGPITAVSISLDAEVFQGSKLTIPVMSETEVSQSSFIKFDTGDENRGNQRQNTEVTGVNFDMNLSILPGAEIEIIMDEQAGDKLQGTGTGDIRLEITRTGGFEMYGNFYIDQGTYLFTALTLIQKPFSIRNGGKITWTGDPLDANIDLLADYRGERVSLDNFIKEYTINNPTLAQKARKRTDVDLLMHLTGSLLHPSVNFDLKFPNLDGDIKSYVFSKMHKLRSDQNLMYTQAVTLLSLGTFLPQDNLSGLVSNESNVSTAATGLHTGLQYSAVLVSKYLSGLFEELLANSSWVSGVDIDINVINSQAIGILEDEDIWPNEYTYDAKLHLFEDKASVEFSGSYVRQGIIDPDKRYANGDFIFKYYFTEDRKLRIEAYSKREFDEFFDEWKWKIGTGLNYQMQFGSIYDLKKDIEEDLKKTEEVK